MNSEELVRTVKSVVVIVESLRKDLSNVKSLLGTMESKMSEIDTIGFEDLKLYLNSMTVTKEEESKGQSCEDKELRKSLGGQMNTSKSDTFEFPEHRAGKENQPCLRNGVVPVIEDHDIIVSAKHNKDCKLTSSFQGFCPQGVKIKEDDVPSSSNSEDKMNLSKSEMTPKAHLSFVKDRPSVTRKWQSMKSGHTMKRRFSLMNDSRDDFLCTPKARVIERLATIRARTIKKSVDGHNQMTNQLNVSGGLKSINVTEEQVIQRSNEGADNKTVDKTQQPSELTRRKAEVKFNPVIRKKDERDLLKAVDCVSCKKFYDAVMAEDPEGLVKNRCDHHQAVSRHRFKYVPPETPAGFWNIGFDSE